MLLLALLRLLAVVVGVVGVVDVVVIVVIVVYDAVIVGLDVGVVDDVLLWSVLMLCVAACYWCRGSF